MSTFSSRVSEYPRNLIVANTVPEFHTRSVHRLPPAATLDTGQRSCVGFRKSCRVMPERESFGRRKRKRFGPWLTHSCGLYLGSWARVNRFPRTRRASIPSIWSGTDKPQYGGKFCGYVIDHAPSILMTESRITQSLHSIRHIHQQSP